MISRERMMQIIQRGGSVLLPNGKLATRIEQLPSAAALATTPEEKEKAQASLDAQIAKLQAEKAKLAEEPKVEEPKVEEPKAEEPAKTKGK